MSFENLKRNRAQIDKLVSAAEKVGGGEKKNYDDDRIWKPTVDKSGNGYAVLRFLPAAEGQDLPWVRYWDHGFQGPTGRWYIENSLTSIGQPDPVSEINSKLWNSGLESDKEIARKQKRRLHYVANVLVVSDPGNPSNEGKVKIFKFGKKIFDKIMDVMQPQFEDEKAVNPFDFWEGADFKLKIRQVEGYRNYDKSEFASAAELFGGDEDKLKVVYEKINNLGEFLDPKNYKSFSELQAKLNAVLGESASSGAPTMREERMVNEPKEAPEIKQPVTAEQSSGDEEDTMSYFARLAEED